MNVVDKSVDRERGGDGRGVVGVSEPTKYATKSACVEAIVSKLARLITINDSEYDASYNYATVYNSWIMATGFYSKVNSEKQYTAGCGERTFEHTRAARWTTHEGFVGVSGTGYGSSLKQARNHSAYLVWYQLRNRLPRVQMDDLPESNQDHTSVFIRYVNHLEYLEYLRSSRHRQYYRGLVYCQMEQPEKESEQGDTTQKSEQQSNTIITRDQQEASQKPTAALDQAEQFVSTEPYHDFQGVTQRWMPISQVPITADKKFNDIIKAISLPEDLFGSNCSPALIPFETFIYGKMDIEIKAVVNSNKFACGKLVMSSKYDTYQAENVQSGTQSALARNHVILDLSTNNEGCLTIPFRYHRPLVRLVKSDSSTPGVRPSKYATLYLHVLSPLQTGPGGPSDINLTLFYRLKSSKFAGMSYRATVQGLGLEDIVTPTTSRALKEVLSGAERAFDQLGKSRNQDKPGVITSVSVVPHPRLNFATGKGPTDVVPLRVNPYTLTNYTHIRVPTDEPKSFQELARIWGVVGSFDWDNAKKAGDELVKIVIDPTCRNYSSDYTGELTPLEYAMENYAFWAGPIELRLDFVSNAFHTGTVQLSAEFGRATASAKPCESESTYTKAFHLGDQKTVSFTIPYIYDTVLRRTTGNVCNPYLNATAADDISKSAATVAPLSRTVFKVRVINPLRPVAQVPQKIEVLVFMRAGKNFVMRGLKGSTLYQDTTSTILDQFPFDYPGLPTMTAEERTTLKEKRLAAATDVKLKESVSKRFERDEKRFLKHAWNEKPAVQMDTGEKENQDTTDDFNVGNPQHQTLQTLDVHSNFKDLLRRPTLLFWNVDVIPNSAKSCTSFMIPLKPPCRAMYGNTTTKTTTAWSQTIHQTSAALIMDMFRAWRGSMRYTICVHSNKSDPVYVSVIPHSGVRMVGNHQITVNGGFPIPGMNFVTEVIIPSVNPCITVEVPYETENTWSLTWDEDPSRNYTWRDKGDDNSGHLAITTSAETKIDVWWSAGDDFEYANFYGIPKATTSGQRYRWADAAKVQMDFLGSETVTKVTDLVGNFMPVLGRAAVATLPIVGQPLVVADVATNVQRNLQVTTDNIGRTLNKIDCLAEQLGTTSFEVTSIIEKAVSGVASTVSGLVQGTVLIYDFLLDIMIAWMERSWKVVGIGIVRFLSKLFCTGEALYQLVLQYGSDLGAFFENLFRSETPRVQLDDNDYSVTLIGILLGLVGTMTGVHIERSPSRYTGYFGGMARRLTTSSGIGYLFVVFRYVQSIFKAVRDMIMHSLGYVNPEVKALQLLSRDKEFISHFVHEAQIITSEANAMLINSPVHRRRYWETVLHAYKIQKILAQAPSNVVSVQLSKLVNDVILKGNEKFLDLSASPVRFEPMVIYITGAPGIGKSFMTEALVDKLLSKTKINGMSTEKIFYRTAGERFWSGYRNQPVVVYDEWLNTRDPQRCMDQLAEMMKLKSTGMFIPEMAHLEEKRIRANPLLIIVLCNDAFPTNLGDYVTCSKASLRRRELVLHTEKKAEFEGIDYRIATPEQRDVFTKFGHLQFGLYKSVYRADSLSSVRKDFDTMSEWVSNQWLNYWNRERENVQKRMERLPHYAEMVNGPLTVRDPFSIFYQINTVMMNDDTVTQNGWTPMEQLEEALRVTAQLLEQPQDDDVEEPELVPWELAQRPQAQIDYVGLGLGVLATGFGIRYILNASRRQLRYWEENFLSQNFVQQCCICFEEKPCIYECKDSLPVENPHRFCVECYHAAMEHYLNRCPMCRSTNLDLVNREEQIRTVSFVCGLILKGMKTVGDGIDFLLKYYNYREDNVTHAILLDSFLDLFYVVLQGASGNTDCAGITIVRAMEIYTRIGYRMYDAGHGIYSLIRSSWESWWSNGHVQMDDDWDMEAGPSTRGEVSNVYDALDITIDPDVLRDWCDGRESAVPCLHEKVLHYSHSASMTGQGEYLRWTIPDSQSQLMIDVPVYACKDNERCLMHNDEMYSTLLKGYIRRHRVALRQKYIALYQKPCDELYDQIPAILRPSWYKPVVHTVGDSWWEYISDQFQKYKTTLCYIAAAIGAVGVVMACYQAATRLVDSNLVQISSTAGSPEASARHRHNTIQRRGGQIRYFQAESDGTDVFTAVMGKVARNSFKLISTRDGEKTKEMYGTGLFGHVLLIPRHYAVHIKDNFMAGGVLYGHPTAQPQLKALINFEPQQLIVSEEVDLAYMVLPVKFPLFKDIRKYIALDDDFNHPLPSSAVLLGNPKTGCSFIREIDVELYGIREDQVVFDQNNKSFVTKEVLVYNYSKSGCCGSLLLRENHQRPIMSMHFAGIGEGLTGEGMGVLLTQEYLGSLATQRGVVQFDDVEYGPIESAKIVYDDDVFLSYYGSVGPSETPYTPSKSKLVKSCIYGAPDLVTDIEPAILSKQDNRYLHDSTPLYEGVKKHGQPTTDFPQAILDRAGEIYWDLCLSTMKPLVSQPKKLTLKQIVCGIPEYAHYTGMDLTTSAGYPYCLNKSKTTKSSYCGVKRNEQLQAIDVEWLDDQVIEIRNKKKNLRKKGIVPHTLFVDTLKDEKRPREKVLSKGGTRVFCGSPMDYVMDCREYFMHFVAAFMDQRMNLMHSVGINPTSEEWTRLTKKLLSKNTRFCTIDYSNFGAGYNANVAKKGYELMIRWVKEHVELEDGDEDVMWCLVYECLQSMHICNNTVYQQGSGSPSGAFFTTIINTIVNILYLIIAWLELTKQTIGKQPKLAATEFRNNVELFCYGDDGIFSVTDEYIGVYNTVTIHEFFSKYGIVSTSGDKYAAIQPTEAISEAQYLKRGFKPHPTRDAWLSPLKEKSIKSATQWVWSSPNLKESTYVNAEAALLQAHGHGPLYFASFKKQLNAALRKAKCKPVTASWEELDDKFFGEGFEFNVDKFLTNTLY